MIRFHPDETQLAEYSAGSLITAQSICVSAHLAYCSLCQQTVGLFNNVGGSLVDSISSNTIPDDIFTGLMHRLDEDTSPDETAEPETEPVNQDDLPHVVSRLIQLGDVRWKKLTPALEIARLKTGQDQYEVALHRIRAGGKVAEHDHQGMEFTVVLRGNFSDADGMYQVGDFLQKQAGEIHQPIASQDSDCLCLTAVDSPVRFTGFARVLNPFLRIHPQ